MKSPEMPNSNHFDQLLDDEIGRMKNPNVSDTPPRLAPLTLAEYRELVADQMALPDQNQLADFISEFEDDSINLYQAVQAGDRLVPLLMPHEHGYPKFEPERLNRFGHLYYYVLDKKNLTVRPDKLAYMDTILPPEIIANGVVIPKDFKNNNTWTDILRKFNGATRQMLEIIK